MFYVSGTVKAIRALAIFADVVIGTVMILGIVCAVLLFIPKKLPAIVYKTLAFTAMNDAIISSELFSQP